MTAKQKSYELYHIGTKLRNIVNLDSLESKLINVLKQKGFNVPEGIRNLTLQPIVLAPLVSTVGIKNQIKVQINFGAGALNIVSQTPENSLEVFEEIISIIENLDYDINSIVEFHEILSNIIIKTGKSPEDILKNLINIRFRTLEKIGYPLQNKAFRLGYKDTNQKILIDFIIEPNPLNPKETLYLKILFRTQDRENLKSFHKELDNIIDDVIKSIGA